MDDARARRRITFSCLCVTQDRPEFGDWLLWNFDKQDHPERQLVIVDSSARTGPWPRRDDVVVVRCAPGTSVPAKRNLAVAHATGEAVTWFDDDDWQHPRKLSLLAGALQGAPLAGGTGSWFVDLASGRARRHRSRPPVLLFNSIGLPTALAASVAFDVARHRASDTPWLSDIRRQVPDQPAALGEPLFLWLSHRRNLSNPADGRKPFPHRLDVVRAAVGERDWGDTDDRLDQLRRQVAAPPPGRTRPGHQPSPPPPTGPTAAGAPCRPTTARPELCIAITTYDRPDSLARLLDDIEGQWPGDGLSVLVFDDASPTDPAPIESRLRRRGWRYVRAEANHGKARWWAWWNTILAELRRTPADRYLVLQDDLRLCRRFFGRLDEAWSRLPAERRASLFLHVDDHTAAPGRARWSRFAEVAADGFIESGWVDLTAFVCDRRLFDALDWELHPPTGRWGRDPLLGSGVGAQISGRLQARQLRMYRVRESLTVHIDTPSRMNGVARSRWPIRTRRFVDGDAAAAELARPRPVVLAALASVPQRERALEAVVTALLPQVDRLGVHLNGYPRVPGFLIGDRIDVVESTGGDRGDAGKFAWADAHVGHLLTCDDDIAYPPDYVAELVAGIERYQRRAVVGFHGTVLHDPVVDFHRSRRLLHFTQALARDEPVHVLGTGVAGYHTGRWTIRGSDLPTPNLADLHLAVAGQDREVPFVCLARRAGWLRQLPGTSAGSLYARAQRAAAAGGRTAETELATSRRSWRLFPVEPPASRPAPPPVARPTAPAPPSAGGEAVGPLTVVPVQGPAHRARLVLPERDHITLAVQRSGRYYESDLLDRIRQLGVVGTYVDVGAHYGNHTLYFALECAAAHVVAIEPNPASARGLAATVQANALERCVTVLELAVHPTSRRVRLEPLAWTPRRTGGARTNTGMVAVRPARDGPIPAQPLDRALAGFDRIAVLKIDAEGSGAAILDSGRSVLARDRPVVAIEATSEGECLRVRRRLEPLGYELLGQFCWTPTWLWSPAGPVRG